MSADHKPRNRVTPVAWPLSKRFSVADSASQIGDADARTRPVLAGPSARLAIEHSLTINDRYDSQSDGRIRPAFLVCAGLSICQDRRLGAHSAQHDIIYDIGA